VRKTFKLQVEGKHPDRVLDAIKHEVRKYVKRQRRVPLPAGVDFWDFACKVGHGDLAPEVKHVEEVVPAIDQAAASACGSVYIEIIATPGHRQKK
jgi:hypothetical protein